jgi:hypothetical protein
VKLGESFNMSIPEAKGLYGVKCKDKPALTGASKEGDSKLRTTKMAAVWIRFQQ